jgi:hypothetical protein
MLIYNERITAMEIEEIYNLLNKTNINRELLYSLRMKGYEKDDVVNDVCADIIRYGKYDKEPGYYTTCLYTRVARFLKKSHYCNSVEEMQESGWDIPAPEHNEVEWDVDWGELQRKLLPLDRKIAALLLTDMPKRTIAKKLGIGTRKLYSSIERIKTLIESQEVKKC